MALEESRRLAQKKKKLECRALILDGIRAFFNRNGFLEIETPVRVPAIAPEQFISPYTSEDWFLSTSPELQMKRLLSAGYEKIFQICHCFRKDECGRHHNPEFTILEWYRAGADYRQIIQDTEHLLADLSQRSNKSLILEYQGNKIDLTLPWPRTAVRDAYLRWAGWDPVLNFDGQRFDDDMVDKVIPCFPADRPMILLDYPVQCASLARLKPGHPEIAERAEVFIGGLEIANAYSELREAAEQAQRFKQEMELLHLAGKPATWPQKFLEAVKELPECGGIALGVDRLVMLLCNARSIDEVVAFPADFL
jgi:elongation factor P--(R)-beta-lysine ligase